MQMALDRYPGHPSPGFPDWTIPHYQRLNWHYPTARYFNSGVMFVRADAASQRLFDQWHRRWRDFQAATGKIDDQPSLNTAIEVANVEVGVLPVRYNAMVRVKERYRWRARVLHFFTRDYDTDEGTEYHSLIHRVEAGEPISAAEIRTAISRRVPLVEPWSLRRYLHAGGFLSAWRLWRAGAEKRLVRQAQESQVDITSMAGKLLSQPIPPVPCTRRAITTHQQRGQFRASHPQ